MKIFKGLYHLVGDRVFFISISIVFVLKVAYLLLVGPTFEVDSWNYIDCVLSFDYPPLYPYFLYVLRCIYPNVYFVCLVQIILLSFCSALFCKHLFKSTRAVTLVSILFGLDPASGYYSCSILSEALFIPLLLIFIVIVLQVFKTAKSPFISFLWIGAMAGVLYSVRFAGILITVVPFLLILIFKQQRHSVFNKFLLIFIGFQLVILPIRYKYLVNFDNYVFNGFSGRLMWNNASAIYPSSKVRDQSENDFENYLSGFPAGYFNSNLAVNGRQLWEDSLPLRRFAAEKKIKFGEMPVLDKMARSTAIRLISEQPLSYLINFVIPNFTKLFNESDVSYAKGYEEKIKKAYNFEIYPKRIMHRYLLAFYFSLLMVITVVSIMRKENKSSISILLVLCWFYALVLPFVSILDSRLYLVLSLPIITLSFFLFIPGSVVSSTGTFDKEMDERT